MPTNVTVERNAPVGRGLPTLRPPTTRNAHDRHANVLRAAAQISADLIAMRARKMRHSGLYRHRELHRRAPDRQVVIPGHSALA